MCRNYSPLRSEVQGLDHPLQHLILVFPILVRLMVPEDYPNPATLKTQVDHVHLHLNILLILKCLPRQLGLLRHYRKQRDQDHCLIL